MPRWRENSTPIDDAPSGGLLHLHIFRLAPSTPTAPLPSAAKMRLTIPGPRPLALHCNALHRVTLVPVRVGALTWPSGFGGSPDGSVALSSDGYDRMFRPSASPSAPPWHIHTMGSHTGAARVSCRKTMNAQDKETGTNERNGTFRAKE